MVKIKKAKNGTYYFRVHLGFNDNGKRIQKYCSGFKTKKDAINKYYELLLQKDELLTVEKKDLNFKEYMNDIFLPWYQTQVKPQTYENRVSSINTHFSYFFKYSINKIEPIDVQKWQLELSKKLKPSYVRLVQGLFSLAIDRAIVLGLAEENPSKAVGNVKKEKTQISFWTREEFEKVMSVIDTSDYYQYFLYTSLWVLFMTGMRIGEATALLWQDIDFSTGILDINKTLNYKNSNNYEFGEPKTAASKRHIVLDSDTLALLEEWEKTQAQVIKEPYFVLSYNGVPTQKHTTASAIKRYSRVAKVPTIRTHDLRHSHASLLIQLGENPLIIRDRLGHDDIETTLGTYGHLYPNTNYEVANKLNGILNIGKPEITIPIKNNQFTIKIPNNV